MELTLKNKRAVVCGASKGIGKAVAFALAQIGAQVTLVSRNKDLLEKVKSELPGNLGHQYLVADTSNPKELEKLVCEFAKNNPKTDILVNNTGGPPGGKAIDAQCEDFLTAFTNHVIANHIWVKNLVPGMQKHNYGRIINIISTSVKAPIPDLGVSNTVRAAVGSWAKTLSSELAKDGITVNNVLPGFTDTTRLEEIVESKAIKSKKNIEDIQMEMKKQIPMGRFAKPNEIANAVAFLASPAASYITGINLPVDGGRTQSL